MGIITNHTRHLPFAASQVNVWMPAPRRNQYFKKGLRDLLAERDYRGVLDILETRRWFLNGSERHFAARSRGKQTSLVVIDHHDTNTEISPWHWRGETDLLRHDRDRDRDRYPPGAKRLKQRLIGDIARETSATFDLVIRVIHKLITIVDRAQCFWNPLPFCGFLWIGINYFTSEF